MSWVLFYCFTFLFWLCDVIVVDVDGVLGVPQHVHDERVADLRYQPPLVVDVVDLLALDNLVLLHEFDRVVLVVLLISRELDLGAGNIALTGA